MRRAPILAALACALACLAACSRELGQRPGNPPKHLLLITVAGLRADHLSAYGYLRPTSAWQIEGSLRSDGLALAVDDLWEQSVSFAHAFATSTAPGQSVASLLTGVAPAALDQRRDAPTIAQELANAGYRTAAFFSGAAPAPDDFARRGFATFAECASDVDAVDRATQTLAQEEWRTSEHLFVWLHLSGPLPPFEPRALPLRPGEQLAPLDFATMFVDPRYAGAIDGSLEQYQRIERGELALDPQDRQRLIDLYDGEVARAALLVRNFVTLYRNLDDGAQIWSDTLLVFAGASGVELLDRSSRAPRGPYVGRERVWVPLWFRHPGSLTGSRMFAEVVDLADVAPTLREWLLGVDLTEPTGLGAGRTLLPLMDSYVQRPFDARGALSTNPARDSWSLRTREWTLLEHHPAGATQPAIELYDRVKDPREEHDLAAIRIDRANELASALRARLAEFQGAP